MASELEPATKREGGPPTGRLIRRGADLVHLSETLHVRLLALTLTMLGAAAGLTIPLAAANEREHARPLTYLFVALALAGSLAGFIHRHRLYRWLRSSRARQLIPAAVASTMLIADGPYSPCWWIAQALLFVVAAVADTGTTVLAGVITAAAYLVGTALRGASLTPAGSGEYVTVAVALVLDPLVARAIAEIFARFTLRLHMIERAAAQAARRANPVDVVVEPKRSVARSSPLGARRPPRESSTRRSSRRGPLGLTARQLQVALLARDGLRQAEIAAALSISPRQVERHLELARERAGAATTAHLIAMLVSVGLAPAAG